MRGGIRQFAMLASAFAAAGCGATVTSAAKTPQGTCRIAAGSKLSADLNRTLCLEVKQAIADAVPGARFDAEVKVLSPARLAAKLVVNGKSLPEQNFAIMDANLGEDSIRRFARSLGEAAKAASR